MSRERWSILIACGLLGVVAILLHGSWPSTVDTVTSRDVSPVADPPASSDRVESSAGVRWGGMVSSDRRETVAGTDLDVMPLHPVPGRRVLGGTVVSSDGAGIAGVVLHVRPRAILPGEDDGLVPALETVADDSGHFSLAVPDSWTHQSVYLVVLDEPQERQLAGRLLAIHDQHTIVALRPTERRGFACTIDLGSCTVERAALMLASPSGKSGFGEAVWHPGSEQPFVELAGPEGDIEGPIVVSVASISADGSVAVFDRCEFSGMPSAKMALVAGLSVRCERTLVSVPAYHGVSMELISIRGPARQANGTDWLDVVDGVVSAQLVRGVEYAVIGRTAEGVQVGGAVVASAGRPAVVWLVDWAEEHVVDLAIIGTDGGPLPLALAAFALAEPGPVGVSMHTGFARAGEDGLMQLTGLCRGRYNIRVDTSSSGYSRATSFVVDVPAPRLQVVVRDSARLQVLPVIRDAPLDLTHMQVWYRRPSEPQWQTYQDPRWRFGHAGIMTELLPGPIDVLVKVDYFVGAESAVLRAGPDLQECRVPLLPEVTAEGLLMNAIGDPVSGRWVSAVDVAADGAPCGPDWTQCVTDAQGHFRLSLLPGSSTPVCIWSADGSTVERRVSVGAGRNIIRLSESEGGR